MKIFKLNRLVGHRGGLTSHIYSFTDHFSSSIKYLSLLLLSMTIMSVGLADGSNQGHKDADNEKMCKAYKHTKTWFIKADAAPGGDGSHENPFVTFTEAQAEGNAKKGDTLRLLKSTAMVDGGVVLKDCQTLIGDEVPENFSAEDAPEFSSITNSTIVPDSNFPGFDYALPVVTLANYNTVKKLHLKAKGSAIFGDNITGSKIEKILVTKDTTYNQAAVDSRYCQIVRDGNGGVINSASTLRGCHPLSYQFAITPDSYPNGVGTIQLFFGDNESSKSFENSLSKVVVEGNRSGVYWEWGIEVSASANVKTTLNLTDIVVRNVGRAFSPQAYDNADVIIQANKIAAFDSIDDGFLYATGFLCSGIAGEATGFGGTCPAATMASPVSENPKMTINIDKSEFNRGGGQALEMVAFDQGKSEEKIHVSKTIITGFSAGIFSWNPSGYPRTGIFDFGCLNLFGDDTVDRDSCSAAGYTSRGENLIFSNNLYYYPGREVLLQGKDDIVAQNNYWGYDIFKNFLDAEYPGRFTDGRVTELVDGERRCQLEYDEGLGNILVFPSASPPLRCQINQGRQLTRGTSGVSGKVNDAFPQLTANLQGFAMPETQTGQVTNDPNDLYPLPATLSEALALGSVVSAHSVVVPVGTVNARFQTYNETTTVGADIDMYVYDPSGNLIAESAFFGNIEVVELLNPMAGTYTVVLYGYDTAGPFADFTLFSTVYLDRDNHD